MLYSCVCLVFCFFFFKQKTAYEMRISDWSSDVCSSDLAHFACVFVGNSQLAANLLVDQFRETLGGFDRQSVQVQIILVAIRREPFTRDEIGRASCRERVCQYV